MLLLLFFTLCTAQELPIDVQIKAPDLSSCAFPLEGATVTQLVVCITTVTASIFAILVLACIVLARIWALKNGYLNGRPPNRSHPLIERVN